MVRKIKLYRMPLKRIHGCLFLFLINLLVCLCFAFQTLQMDKLYFSSISNVTSFRMFYDVSLSQCINECKFRLRCDAIDYSYTRKSCFLINEPLTSNEDSRMGFVGGRKAEWDMVNIGFTYIRHGDRPTFVWWPLWHCRVEGFYSTGRFML